jgi:hypothetical protein
MFNLKAFALLLALGLVGTSATHLAHAQLPYRARMLAANAFQPAVNQSIEAELKLYPERATALGDHRFDARVDDDSAAGIKRIVSHAKRWTKIFCAFDAISLSPSSEAGS